MLPLTTPGLARRWSLPLAVLAGMLLGLGMAPMGVWPATMAGVGLVTWLFAGRRAGDAALHGLLMGAAMNTLVLHWIDVLGAAVAFGLVGIMSLWMLLFGMTVALLTTVRGWALWVPAAWVALELLVGLVPFGGFPWVRLALTALDQPLAGWFPLVGAAGVSFLLALVANLALTAILQPARRWAAAGFAVTLFAAGGALTLVHHDTPAQDAAVGLVQGNVNRVEKGTGSYARSNTANNLSETIFLLASNRANNERPLDFIVWAENATDIDPRSDVTTGRVVETAVQLADVPIFVGAVMDGPQPDTRQTSSLWWDPVTGIGGRYDKRNLVPFGEWIPFRDFLLPRLPVLKQIGRQSIAGSGPGVVDAPTAAHPTLRVGTIICFELAWDDTSYDTIRGGAQILTSQSNTNTYAGTFEVPQQTALNRVRALETGREVVVSTLNGLSGLVGVDGRMQEETSELTRANRTFTVPLRSNQTLAVTLGAWPSVGLTVVTLAALAWAGVAATRRRRAARLLTSSSESIGRAA